MNSGILSWLSNGPILSSYDFLLPPLLGRTAEALLEAADKRRRRKKKKSLGQHSHGAGKRERRRGKREEGRVRSNVTEMKKETIHCARGLFIVTFREVVASKPMGRDSARGVLSDGNCKSVSSCVSTTPRTAQSINIAIKLETTTFQKNFLNITDRFLILMRWFSRRM